MKRILWIEDEGKIELIHFKTPLVRNGYVVDIGADATEAIRFLKEKVYDILIFDLHISCGEEFKTGEHYAGIGLLKEIIDEKIEGIIEKYAPSKMMVFSVVNDTDVHKKIKELGVNTILVKGLHKVNELKLCIDKLIKN